MVSKRKQCIVAIGDTHFPYHNVPALKWALKKIKALQPSHVIQIGDIYDFFWFSKYPKKFLEMGPDQEVKQGRRIAEAFWSTVQKNAKKAQCHQILGNHDDRPAKRVQEKFPELANFLSMDHLFQFDGVRTNLDSRSELHIKINGNKICFQHGHLSRLGAHMAYNQMSTVVGHSHRGGVVYDGRRDDVIYELNCGFLGDQNAGPLQYGATRRKNWTLGLGVIDEHGPRFIPYG